MLWKITVPGLAMLYGVVLCFRNEFIQAGAVAGFENTQHQRLELASEHRPSLHCTGFCHECSFEFLTETKSHQYKLIKNTTVTPKTYVIENESNELDETNGTVDCGIPEHPLGGTIYYPKYRTYGASANLTCIPGLVASSSTLICDETGSWQNATCEPECGWPHSILNGNLTYFYNDTTNGFMLTCFPGHETQKDFISCTDGKWELTSCEPLDFDECSSGPCENGGNCTDGINNYTCTCIDGYTGDRCETDIDECSSGPCENGGNCTDGINNYTCTCIDGYTGDRCETDIDECSSGPCDNGGNCTDGINNYTCTCIDGYTGDRCETDIDECASNPCKNGATCIDQINGYRCECSSNYYTGKNCDIDNGPCKNSPCLNGGTCIYAIRTGFLFKYFCSCTYCYEGLRCESYHASRCG